jgi:hypothetical protein
MAVRRHARATYVDGLEELTQRGARDERVVHRRSDDGALDE